MVNSFSQKIIVSCPDCQKSITTEVWLIIDLCERRDLRNRIIEDSINLQHCSSCGCDFFIDSPLLIYRHEETPALVFSPAQHSSQENDEEHINFLINILFRNLGSGWRDEWLDNIITVPQSILPDVISEGASDPQQILDRDAEDFNEDFIESILNHLQEEEPSAYKKLSDNVEQLKRLKLLTLLQEFTSNPNQIEARHIVENNPILLSRDADELLGIMEGNAQRDNNEKAVQEFQDYRYLLRRCREVGTLEAFAEKMQTSTEAFQGFENLFKLFPDLSNSIRELINSGGSNPSVEDVMALISKKPEIFKTINTQSAKLVDETKEMFLQIDQIQQKYIKSEELPELNKTALLVDNVLSNPLLFLVPRDVHCAVLNDASVLYQIQYNISGNQEFFSKSLELLRKCIQKIDPGSEDYYKYLPNLGLALIEDYDGNGKIEHFIEAIDVFRKLVTETQETNPKWFLYAGSLATSLYSAYSVSGDINYIKEAINISDKALDIITAENNELPSILDISGSILLAYYDLTDDLNTLENAVQKFQKSVAISSTEGNKIKLAYRLNNFGNGLHKSYLATGNLEQLESAIHNLRSAVTTTTPGTPRWSQYAGNLSAAILSLYQRIGNLNCLEESIDIAKNILNVTPLGSFHRSTYLNHLGMSLHLRYQVIGEVENLNDAVLFYRQALSSITSDSPNEIVYLSNLGVVLSDLYERVGKESDLEEAIQVFKLASEKSSAKGFSRLDLMNKIGTCLLSRYKMKGCQEDLQEAIKNFLHINQVTKVTSPDLPMYQSNLGMALIEKYKLEGNATDLQEAVYKFQQALESKSLNATLLPGLYSNLGNGYHTLYLLVGDHHILNDAIEAYEKAVKYLKENSPEYAMYISNLGTALLDRFIYFGNKSDLEEAIAFFKQAVNKTLETSPGFPINSNNLGLGYMQRYHLTSKLEDLQEAIKQYREAIKHSDPNSTQSFSYLNNLGSALSQYFHRTGDLRDLEEAIKLFQRAVEQSPSESPSRGLHLTNLGNGFMDYFRVTSKIDFIEQALSCYQGAIDSISENSPGYATYLNNFGGALSVMAVTSNNLELINKMIDIYQKAVDVTKPDSPDYPYYLGNLASAYSDRYDLTKTPEDFSKANYLYKETCQRGLETALETIMHTSIVWGNWTFEHSAWPEACEAFKYVYQIAEKIYKYQLLHVSKKTWLRDFQGIPSKAAYALAKNGDIQGAILALEVGCTRILSEVLELNYRNLEKLTDIGYSDLLEDYRSAADRYYAIQSNFNSQKRGSDLIQTPYDNSMFIRDLEECKASLDKCIEDVRSIPGFADYFSPVNFERIRQVSLSKPLVYLITTQFGSLAMIVTSNETRLIWLEFTRSSLISLFQYNQLAPFVNRNLKANITAKDLEKSLLNSIPILGKELMAHIASYLLNLGIDSIILVPIGLLGLFPLHATSYNCDGETKYLLDEIEVSYAPTAQAIATINEQLIARQNNPSTFIGVGNPLPTPQPLPFAQVEVQTISSFFGDAHSFFEYSAKKESLQRIFPNTAYLHFACHGSSNFMEPLQSSLLLSNQETLSLDEVLWQDPSLFKSIRLVVLSACQTALADFLNLPDEAIGFPSGFLQSGIPGVIGSLWNVNDFSTALLMIYFYKLLQKSKLDPKNALRYAQIWLRDSTNEALLSFAKAEILDFDQKFPEVVEMLSLNPQGYLYNPPYFWASFRYTGI